MIIEQEVIVNIKHTIQKWIMYVGVLNAVTGTALEINMEQMNTAPSAERGSIGQKKRSGND